jgi:dienelactone hydrolase
MEETQIQREPLDWYRAFGFQEHNFAFQMAWALGQAYDRQGDIAEIMATGAAIKDGDTQSWYDEWIKTAERVAHVASACEDKGHLISAGEAYHRASNYFRTAEFYLHQDPSDQRALGAAAMAVDCFRKAMRLLAVPVEVISMPYEDTTLPGYFYTSQVSVDPAPVVIVHTGFDGSAEELYGIAKAATMRGYHCLIFDGPGQGQAVRAQDLLFRHDWEKVISPVLDYAVERPEVDPERIAVLGISLGGWLVTRAACYEHRPAVYIPNPGTYSFYETLTGMMPASFIAMAESDPEAFNAKMTEMCAGSISLRWGMQDGVWKFGAEDTADLILKMRAYELDQSQLDQITSHMLIVDAEGERIMGEGQPDKLYARLTCPKDLMIFTIEEGAEAHCQIAALSVLYQRTFDWLDEFFGN